MKRVEVLAVLFWVMGGLQVLAAMLFAVAGVLGAFGILDHDEPPDERLKGAVGALLVFSACAVSAAAHLATGTGLRRFRPWARVAGLIVAVVDILLCCAAPLATALGIYALIVLLSADVRALFEPRVT